jgi:hypothetical protein
MTSLQAVATFIKDWIPPIGIIAGVLWVIFRWLYSEKLRRQKERNALDGELTSQSVSLSEEKIVVLFNARWNNRSPLPFQMDTKNSGLDIFRLDGNIPIGGLDLRIDKGTLGQPVVELRPYQNLKSLIIEPGTQSTFQHMAVLEKGSLYLVRYKIYRSTEKGKFSRTRLCICDLRQT